MHVPLSSPQRSNPAAPAILGRHPAGGVLATAARDELCRPKPSAQPRAADRICDHRPDVRHHSERSRPVARGICRLRRLRRRHLAHRAAAARDRGSGRRHSDLCRGRRADPSQEPAVHRRDAGHVVRLARPGDPRAADARRQGAGLAARIDDLEDSIRAVHHLRTAGAWRWSCISG